MAWGYDVVPNFVDPKTLSHNVFDEINAMYNEIIDLSEGTYNLFRVIPDGTRMWTDYYLSQNPGGVAQFDTTTDLYGTVELLVLYANDIVSDNTPALVRFLGDGEDEADIQLLAKGEYLLNRIAFFDEWDLDTTSFPRYFTFEDTTGMWPTLSQAQFDQMDDNLDGEIDENDLIAFLDEPDRIDRGSYPSTYDPTLCLRRIYLELKEIRDNLKKMKWRSRLQNYLA
jgi:hypothetical protein